MAEGQASLVPNRKDLLRRECPVELRPRPGFFLAHAWGASALQNELRAPPTESPSGLWGGGGRSVTQTPCEALLHCPQDPWARHLFLGLSFLIWKVGLREGGGSRQHPSGSAETLGPSPLFGLFGSCQGVTPSA